MILPVTISGHLTLVGPPGRIHGFEAGPWKVHTGGSGDNVLHELWGFHGDAEQWIRDHGLTYAPDLLVNL